MVLIKFHCLRKFNIICFLTCPSKAKLNIVWNCLKYISKSQISLETFSITLKGEVVYIGQFLVFISLPSIFSKNNSNARLKKQLTVVAQNLIFITSYYIYSRLLIILFSNEWCLLKATFFWKTTFVVIYSKLWRFYLRKL